jgi:hypothetical protein
LDRDVIIGQKAWGLDTRGQLPTFEPEAGAGGIKAGCAIEVLAKIKKDVDESVADLAWGAERSGVVAIGEDLAFSGENAIERVRETNRDACHPTGKSDPIIGFYDQMNVVGLYREMHHAKPVPPGPGDCSTKRSKDQLLAKAGQSA